MSKQFLISVIIGVLVLFVFAYFIFGLNGSVTTQTAAPSIAAPSQQPQTLRRIVQQVSSHVRAPFATDH